MSYECAIIADSIGELTGKRITTFQVTYPRIIHSEFMTHRMFSRNSASSRAIPVERMVDMVMTDPYVPIFTGAQAGMVGIDKSDNESFQANAQAAWLGARNHAVAYANALHALKVAKGETNRLLEPWLWHTVVVTATEWANFFALRCHPAAHPAIRKIAEMMRDAMLTSKPQELTAGEWHLPYVTDEDVPLLYDIAGIKGNRAEQYDYWRFHPVTSRIALVMSTARCARVSYLRQGDRKSYEEDKVRHDSLLGDTPKHASPAEHQAQSTVDVLLRSGNFIGWRQYRHTIKGESTTHYEWHGQTITDR